MKNPSLDAGRRRGALPRLAAHLDRDAAEARADAEHYARQGNTSMQTVSMVAVGTCERAAAKLRDEYVSLTSGPRKI
ncbi:MAG: hypothetical protein ACRC67_07230 [Inquilinus sp.]|uniref:hypothetical protein n=1 Tax=Inquilinus sp. TaxID=1932117 RepID=UPI003F412596